MPTLPLDRSGLAGQLRNVRHPGMRVECRASRPSKRGMWTSRRRSCVARFEMRRFRFPERFSVAPYRGSNGKHVLGGVSRNV